MEYSLGKQSKCDKVMGALIFVPPPAWGLTEQEVRQRTGLAEEELLQAISQLLENRWITTRLSQEGTSGPFIHRYRVGDNVKVIIARPSSDSEK